MKVNINNKETETAAKSVAGLAEELPAKGVAVAIGNKLVARTDWSTTPVEEGDNIVIIKAFCGG